MPGCPTSRMRPIACESHARLYFSWMGMTGGDLTNPPAQFFPRYSRPLFSSIFFPPEYPLYKIQIFLGFFCPPPPPIWPPPPAHFSSKSPLPPPTYLPGPLVLPHSAADWPVGSKPISERRLSTQGDRYHVHVPFVTTPQGGNSQMSELDTLL